MADRVKVLDALADALEKRLNRLNIDVDAGGGRSRLRTAR